MNQNEKQRYRVQLMAMTTILTLAGGAWAYVLVPSGDCVSGVRSCAARVGGVNYQWSCNCPPSTPDEACGYEYNPNKSTFFAMCFSNPGPTERRVPYEERKH